MKKVFKKRKIKNNSEKQCNFEGKNQFFDKVHENLEKKLEKIGKFEIKFGKFGKI